MSEIREIIGNTTATPTPRSDWEQADPAKADYIKNKPDFNMVVKTGVTSNQYALDSSEKTAAAEWLGVPSAYESENPDLVVDIRYKYNEHDMFQQSEDLICCLVSEQVFTKEEMLSVSSPFYIEVKDVISDSIATSSVLEADQYDGDGYFGFGIGNAFVYVVYDCTVAKIVAGYPPKNGIYFSADSSYWYVRLERLYRGARVTVKIDNKHLDLEQNEDFMNLKNAVSDCVKSTDYANKNVAGLIKGSGSDSYTASNGVLDFYDAGEKEIRQRNDGTAIGNRLIKFKDFDLALKWGLLDNRWSFDTYEMLAVKSWLGISNPSYNDLNNKPFYDGVEAINIGGSTSTSRDLRDYTAYLQTERTYSVEALIGARVRFNYEDKWETVDLNMSRLVEDTVMGTTFDVKYGFYIVVARDVEYSPPIGNNNTMGLAGVYFVCPKETNYYMIDLLKESTPTKCLDNKYLDLANNDIIKAILVRIEALESK